MTITLPGLKQRLRADLGRPIHRLAPRVGICLHYDASVTDPGALSWLTHPDCKLGYNYLVWDDGTVFEVIPGDRRAPHAGVTRSSDPVRLPYPNDLANSALYGVAIAAGGRPGDRATPKQIGAVAALCRAIYLEERWDLSETYRITSHYAEAWPRRRKVDIIGPDPKHPVMTLDEVRVAFTQTLGVAA